LDCKMGIQDELSLLRQHCTRIFRAKKAAHPQRQEICAEWCKKIIGARTESAVQRGKNDEAGVHRSSYSRSAVTKAGAEGLTARRNSAFSIAASTSAGLSSKRL